MNPRWYFVTSPKWEECENMGEGVTGPPEEMQEYFLVRTSSATRAKVLSVRAWRRRVRDFSMWRPGSDHRNKRLQLYSFDGTPDFLCEGENPFRGMSVKLATEQEIAFHLHDDETAFDAERGPEEP